MEEILSFETPSSVSSWMTVDEWKNHRLRLNDFRLFRRGRRLSEQARIDPAQIRSFGFLLADKQAGPFELEARALQCRR